MPAEISQTTCQTERVSTPETPLNSPSTGVLRPPAVTSRYSPADRAWLHWADRAILRVRVAALEREVERREQRLYRVIEQYERLLTERADARAELDSRTGGVEDRGGVFGRLQPLLDR